MNVFLFLTLLLCPTICFAKGTITLKELSTDESKSIYTLEASNIEKGIIGISATLNLSSDVHLEKFIPGNFLEQEPNSNVQYLIAPKTTDPSKLMLGIASLGAKPVKGNGIITTLHFTKSKKAQKSIISFSETVVSGIENSQRKDFTDITWSLRPQALTNSGIKALPAVVLISFLLALLLTMRSLTFKKGAKMWYNYLKTHKNKHVSSQKTYTDQEKGWRKKGN